MRDALRLAPIIATGGIKCLLSWSFWPCTWCTALHIVGHRSQAANGHRWTEKVLSGFLLYTKTQSKRTPPEMGPFSSDVAHALLRLAR